MYSRFLALSMCVHVSVLLTTSMLVLAIGAVGYAVTLQECWNAHVFGTAVLRVLTACLWWHSPRYQTPTVLLI